MQLHPKQRQLQQLQPDNRGWLVCNPHSKRNKGELLMKYILVIVLFASTLLLPQALAVVSTPVSSCQNITASGFYALTQNLSGVGGVVVSSCIRISADNVHLSCAGFTIRDDPGGGGPNGIHVVNQKGISIVNCIVRDYDANINLRTVKHSNVTDTKALFAEAAANLILDNNTEVNITRSNFDFSFADGVEMDDSNSSYFIGNVITFNGLTGWNVQTSNNNTFINNTFFANDGDSVLLEHSHNTTFRTTSIRSSRDAGFRVITANNTRLIDTFTEKNGPAISILASQNVTAYNFSLGG